MKQGKLIRRAVSAALAGCMMFTLSAPALAESTDALMQLSTGSYRSSSLLSEENSFPTDRYQSWQCESRSLKTNIQQHPGQ